MGFGGKYRQKNEPNNCVCNDCNKEIWSPTGVRTIYHLQENWSENLKNKTPESVVLMDVKNETISAILVCHKCSKKYRDENEPK